MFGFELMIVMAVKADGKSLFFFVDVESFIGIMDPLFGLGRQVGIRIDFMHDAKRFDRIGRKASATRLARSN